MCIDESMISLYADGELGEPYRTQVEEHISHCSACKAVYERYMALDRKIKDSELSEKRAEERKKDTLSYMEKKYLSKGEASFFRRRLEVSLTSLTTVAAAVVFVFVGAFVFFGRSAEETADILPSFAVSAGENNIVYVSEGESLDNYSLEEIMKYLDRKGYNVDISIKGISFE